MPEKYLYEYTVIRVVPRVEREEFFNVGIILFCKALGFLKVMYEVNEKKLSSFCTQMELSDLEDYLATFENIANGSGPIGQYPLAERFRWLTATRSTVIQTSKTHPGLTTDPSKKLVQLFEELVK